MGDRVEALGSEKGKERVVSWLFFDRVADKADKADKAFLIEFITRFSRVYNTFKGLKTNARIKNCFKSIPNWMKRLG
jgi:hypothetical protein